MKKPILMGLILLTVILPLLVIPSLNEIYIFPKITVLSCFLSVLIFLWAVRVRLAANAKFFSSPFSWPVFLFLAVNLLSLLKAVNVPEGLYHILWLFTYVMMFFLVINNLNLEDFKKIIHWSIVGGVIVSAIGIGQFWGLNLSFLPFQLGSTLGTKNMSAQHIILILPLAFWGFFFHPETKKEIFYGFAYAAMAIFLVYTQSRGSWVGFIGALIFMLILVLKSNNLPALRTFFQLTIKKIFILSLFTGLVILGVVAPHFIKAPGVAEPEEFAGRFQSIFGYADPSAQSRLAMWANTLQMIKDNYLLGVGVGNWKFIYPLYSRSRSIDPLFSDMVQPHNTHNDWAQMAAEIGLGIFVFLWLIFVVYKTGWKVFLQGEGLGGGRNTGLAVFFLLWGISALLINAFFDFPFMHPVPLFYFYMYLGFIHLASNPPSQHFLPPKRFLPLLLILANFFLIAFAALNLHDLKGSYHFRQGMRQFMAGQLPEAVIQVKKATSLDPHNYRYYTNLSKIYFDVQQYDQAAVAARLALLYHPNHANAWNNLGAAFSMAGLLSDADGAFQKALQIYPDYFLAHLNLGNVYARVGEKEKAKREYRIALSLRPKSKEALKYLEAVGASQNDKILSE